VVGPSGSGKSTLLRIIAGFEAPDAGQLTLDSDLLANGPFVVPAHKRGIGLVAQEGALFPHLSVADNIGFGIKRGASGRSARIAALLDMVELDSGMLGRRPDQLSGGQQQRVALARALAGEPRLMLLDEPFSALDAGLRASTRKAVAELLGRAGITTILVTHDQAEALGFADQVAVLQEGRLLQAGPPHELYVRPRDATVAQFLGDAILLPAVLADGLADCALGRLATDAPRRNGPAVLMLRPEQVVIRRGGDGAVRGRVTGVDFAGAVCTASVALEAPLPPLMLRCPSFDMPATDEVVGLAVSGVVHVLDACATTAPSPRAGTR
jgi:iron(III) transport system ATP-binding protein